MTYSVMFGFYNGAISKILGPVFMTVPCVRTSNNTEEMRMLTKYKQIKTLTELHILRSKYCRPDVIRMVFLEEYGAFLGYGD